MVSIPSAHPPSPAQHSQAEPTLTLAVSLLISYVAYRAVYALVPALAQDLVAKGLKGRDMLKIGFKRDETATEDADAGDEVPGRKYLPEATGVIGASVYILLLSLFAPLPYLSSLLPSSLLSPSSSFSLPGLNTTSNLLLPTDADDPCAALLLEGSLAFPHHSFATYLASLLSLLIATFLGFCDDVFDIRWRFKLPIPVIASVPLLVTYAAGHGVTDIVLPKFFKIRELFNVVATNGVLHLGPLYYVYMSMLSTFCTNSINILAGVNGVEVTQSLLIGLSIILNDLLYLTFSPAPFLPLLSLLPASLRPSPEALQHLSKQTWSAGFAHGSQELADRHLFSLYFMLPLVGVCLGLLRHNWYPANAFIGDTFCYFSGMAFAVVGILGHFSKTLLLFFLPQIFNFLYSVPQLFGLVPCPRHRLPRLDPKTGRLVCSWAPIPPPAQRTGRQKVGVVLLKMVAPLGLVKLQYERDSDSDPNDNNERGEIVACTNLTILNLLLLWGGSVREDVLTRRMGYLQLAGSAIAFGIRYGLGGWAYGGRAAGRE
ncbi:hypothetical protein JCM10908_006711 [Rhodotorula pacifica]|uniref:UDP-N-acetylglucosamine--dolichyl-phosphate N-acetylglucosaminephosphotransferase n=1 Tax=Rhodotorula pacifica TaxID=1495444 RepID=UPI00317BEC68